MTLPALKEQANLSNSQATNVPQFKESNQARNKRPFQPPSNKMNPNPAKKLEAFQRIPLSDEKRRPIAIPDCRV